MFEAANVRDGDRGHVQLDGGCRIGAAEPRKRWLCGDGGCVRCRG
jgi:hypothetical protein